MAILVPKTKSISKKSTAELALSTFFNIVEKWQIPSKDQMTLLGLAAPSTFYKFKKEKKGTLSKDMLERISYILGIYKDLQILLPNHDSADQWIKKPNQAPLFGGKSALDRMLSGKVSDLFVVRQYLDAERGGWA